MIKNTGNKHGLNHSFLYMTKFFGIMFLLAHPVGAEVQLPYLHGTGDSAIKVVKIVQDGIIYEDTKYGKDDLFEYFKGPVYHKIPASRLNDEDLKLFGLSKEAAEKFREEHKITHDNILGLKAKREDFIRQYGYPSMRCQIMEGNWRLGHMFYLCVKPMYIDIESYGTLTGEAHVYYEPGSEAPVIITYGFTTLDGWEFYYPDYDERFAKSFLASTALYEQWKKDPASDLYFYNDEYVVQIYVKEKKLISMFMASLDFQERNKRSQDQTQDESP